MSNNRQHKNKENVRTKKWQKALMAGVVLVPLATGIAPVLADSATPTPVSVQSSGTKVKVDDNALQKQLPMPKWQA